MPIVILRPDNFLDPDGKFNRITNATTGSELLEKVKEIYHLEQIVGRAEIFIYNTSIGYTNRRRLDTLDVISGTDPIDGWVFIKPIRQAEALPSADSVS